MQSLGNQTNNYSFENIGTARNNKQISRSKDRSQSVHSDRKQVIAVSSYDRKLSIIDSYKGKHNVCSPFSSELSLKQQSLLCPLCSRKNDKNNLQCTCQQPLHNGFPSELPLNQLKISYRQRLISLLGGSYCPKCNSYLMVQSPTCEICTNYNSIPFKKNDCVFCFQKVQPKMALQHESLCTARLSFFDPSLNPTFDRCTSLQIETVYYMHHKCERKYYELKQSLTDRIMSQGYSLADLDSLHRYISYNAPIIIHIHADSHFKYFMKDTHYRNQFETKMSSGGYGISARATWENRMFDKKHAKATDFERVKYGVLNITNDPCGVHACSCYGQSYFLMKPHVRDRCTITHIDSSLDSAVIATVRCVDHLLNKLNNTELRLALEAAKHRSSSSVRIKAYKEIQIHGPVQFAKDIERVYISRKELKLVADERALIDMIELFCKNNNLEYEIFEKNYSETADKSLRKITTKETADIKVKQQYIDLETGGVQRKRKENNHKRLKKTQSN